MKISVIIPVYRVEHTLRRCVDSILRQDFTDWEMILVDAEVTILHRRYVTNMPPKTRASEPFTSPTEDWEQHATRAWM